jgi:hypothetical protein
LVGYPRTSCSRDTAASIAAHPPPIIGHLIPIADGGSDSLWVERLR